MTNEKLTISFSIWGIFCNQPDNVYYDWDKLMQEYVDRGFNCIRLETGHGLLTDLQGNPIEELPFYAPFGKFSKFLRQMDCIPEKGVINFRERLLELFRAADKYNIKIVLSSWFYIHTYWMLDEAVCAPLLALTVEEKIAHFAKDLDIIFNLLEEHNLIHCVAFAELFNEMNYMPSLNPPIGTSATCSQKHAQSIRAAHEEAIHMLRQKHPTIRMAYDVSNPYFRTDLVPRNIDVLNFHSYFMWNAYKVFEQNCVTDDLNEPNIPETIQQYLNMEITNDDILDAMPGPYINNIYSWVSRPRLYADIKEDKLEELGSLINDEIVKNYDQYLAKMKSNVDRIVFIRDQVVPNAELVMGEGVTYCPAQKLTFEEQSEAYWSLIEEQANYLREKGFWGTVVRTTSGPEDPSWECCKEQYVKMNRLF
ncbi:MAG: hypothetical protein IKU10_05065, partial [Clostridia bacterium]|nr:hypothetical protein [Clostridia bacterium]